VVLRNGNRPDKVRLVHTLIGGAARTMLLNQLSNNRATLTDIDRFFRKHFAAVKVNWTGELFRTKQEPGKSVKTYATRLKLVIFKSRAAYHSYDPHANELDFLVVNRAMQVAHYYKKN
jgi:hypothetical protein